MIRSAEEKNSADVGVEGGAEGMRLGELRVHAHAHDLSYSWRIRGLPIRRPSDRIKVHEIIRAKRVSERGAAPGPGPRAQAH
jgi:hypothetical protein